MITSKELLKIFTKECRFVIGAARIIDIPKTYLPEVAFIGRSNIGKSSLINAVVKRNRLAKTSQKPGCTKQVNFFNLDNKILLVDLPGYGFARISHKERNNWQETIYTYLLKRPQLKRAFLLIDSRHDIKDSDINTMKFLDDCAIPYQLILTKVDKISQTQLEMRTNQLQTLIDKHAACIPKLIATSSKNKQGMDSLRLEIAQFFNK